MSKQCSCLWSEVLKQIDVNLGLPSLAAMLTGIEPQLKLEPLVCE